MENEYPEGRVLSAGEPTGKKLFEHTRVGIRQDLASFAHRPNRGGDQMANLGRLAIAMLGVLAYQNRDKLCELIPGAGYLNPNDPQRRILAQITNGVSRADLGEILDRFREVGAGSKVDSWVGSGPNQPIEPRDVEAAMDEGTLTSISMQTGLSREELIRRIARDLPEAVNEMTPNGEWPPEPRQGLDESTLLDNVS
ncbi:YidB family protein [Mesorhizobium sp. M0410]|uniref:YidB family protein n=3 Tax=Mesorhizobium TaxID=68287 RepID=UPI003335CCD7